MKTGNKYFIVCPNCEHIHIYDSQKYNSGQHCCPNCGLWLMSDEIPEPMPVFSVRQPWAWLLCAGIKDIENRTWKMPDKHKGKWVLIHAGAKPVKMINPNNVFIYDQWESLSYDHQLHVISGKIQNSAIIGAVKFEDCFINHNSIWAEKSDDHQIMTMQPIYNWLVSHPILFDKPILNVKGKLSFFYPTFE